ncbi:MAG: glycosyl hydrolase [Candidatus Eisenbacteria bacterium]|nr:glycosyl hydrolase [Candidatus Eisenbacteria bacterium]
MKRYSALSRATAATLLGAALSLALALPLHAAASTAAKKPAAPAPALEKLSLGGLAFRSIGPAVTGGRVVGIEVNPRDHSEYYVAVGHGSLWKTINAGVTFSPIFDGQSAFSIGAVTLDPSNPNVVWVGTGENNAQTYVVPGDGVYRSDDGGGSWTNMGLKESQHIGAIVVHPKQPNTVWVAAYGAHRTSGGERGVFKTTDGGKTWSNVLHPSDHTGCWELHIDPRDPDVLYAVAHQRQRYLTTTVQGGDESGIYKTTDGGTTWKRLTGGLPQKMVGRIGMDISPANPDRLYAVVDAKEKKEKGTYVSNDAGASWTRASDYVTSYPFYMQKLFCDPKNVDRVYGMDVFNQVSTDGGKSWSRMGEDLKHVDNHALWIDPSDPRHMLSGTDGGVYESFDRAATWAFKANLPVAEIYRVTVDNEKPFYNVYIGTQDNNSLGGPSRTLNSSGITNGDWTFTLGGDGFQSQVDWSDPNIVYSQAQFGALVRYDRRTGERLYLRGFEDAGKPAYRFDWDTPLLISRHDHKRLYHGANLVLRSDDRGESWREISPDLTRGVPKELHDLMGRSWSTEEMVVKASFAHITTLAESPLDAQRLYAGSGDGLLHYTHDGGKTWQRAVLPGLPEFAHIHEIAPSPTDANVALVACNNFFAGDYAPYVYKTTDGGAHWTSISANLPARGPTWTVGVDEVNPDLMFVGTMNGVYFSNTPQAEWIKLSAGIPSAIQVMSLAIQRDEHDLVVSTYGRGVYILDDYTPLRTLNARSIETPAMLLPIADAPMFIQADPLGFPGTAFQGASFYSAPNPEVGAVITYFVKDDFKSLKKKRIAEEKKLQEAGKHVPFPSHEQLKREANEEEPSLLFVISDSEGRALRKIKKPVKAGVQRFVWDFRTSRFGPIELSGPSNPAPWDEPERGWMVPPGTYTVTMHLLQDGKLTPMGSPQSVKCQPLNAAGIPAAEQAALRAFNEKAGALSRAISAADAHRASLNGVLPYLEAATMSVPKVAEDALGELLAIKARLKEIDEALNGDALLPKFEGQSRMSLKGRTDLIIGSLWSTTAAPTGTYERAYDEARASFGKVLADLRAAHERVQAYEARLEQVGAPYTPGRMPAWVETK